MALTLWMMKQREKARRKGEVSRAKITWEGKKRKETKSFFMSHDTCFSFIKADMVESFQLSTHMSTNRWLDTSDRDSNKQIWAGFVFYHG